MVAGAKGCAGPRTGVASVGPDPRAGMVAPAKRSRSATRCWLQWGPTRGPGWSADHTFNPWLGCQLQWGPTRGPGWSFGGTPRRSYTMPASVGPDPRAGMVESQDVVGQATRSLASVGPDPRAGMVAGPVSHGRCHTLASVGPDPRAGMVVEDSQGGRYRRHGCFSGARPEGRDGRRASTRGARPSMKRFSGARPEGRDGRTCARTRRASAPGFSGARPEGRDGRHWRPVYEDPHRKLQWGPTRGPGWSCLDPVTERGSWLASVGPDPRAGMVAAPT